MAEQKFNAIGGFSVGANATGVIDSNANITANSLTANGNVSFTGSNVSLGNIANLKITGGSANQVLSTDGSGNLTFIDPEGGVGNVAAIMPFYIATASSYTVPANFQGLFAEPIVVDGDLEVDGLLIDVNPDLYSTTSSTSVSIGTGTKNFTVANRLAYTTGQPVIAANSITNKMLGEVISYDANTGALSLNSTSFTGSGTYTSWEINLSGTPGPTGPTGNAGTASPKALSIGNPTPTEDVTFFYTTSAITISNVFAVVQGTATPSATTTIRYGSNRAATGTLVVNAANANSTTTAQALTLTANVAIPANSFIWLETTATTGTVDELSVTLIF